jgi:hypothetical protein
MAFSLDGIFRYSFEQMNVNKGFHKHSPKKVTKLSLILLCATIVLLMHAYHTAYPLTQTETTGFIFEVPLTFWAGTFLGIFALTSIATSAKSIHVSLFVVWGFYIIIEGRQLLYYNLDMSDNTTITTWISLLGRFDSLPSPGTPEYFDYLQWPFHHVITMFVQRLADVGVIRTMELGYFTYLTVFSVAVFIYTYTHIKNSSPFYLYSAPALFFVISWHSINNQFVPQFLALIILVFLLSFNNKMDKRWVGIRALFFIALVLSHPFFFVFYILAVLFNPAVSALKIVLDHQTGDSRRAYQAIISVAKTPTSASSRWIRELPKHYSSQEWITWTTTIVLIYVVHLIYRFVSFQYKFIAIMGRRPTSSRTPLGVITRLLPDPVRNRLAFLLTPSSEPSGPATVLLYEFASTDLHAITRHGSVLLVLSVFFLLVFSYLTQKIRYISSINISVLIGSGIYFLIGSFLPLLAERALQVFFLPMVIAIGALRNRPRFVKVSIAFLLLCSPVFMANTFVNQSITAGGNTEDYHTTVAGDSLLEVSEGNLLVPHDNSIPVKANDSVISIQEVFTGSYNVKDGDIVISAPVVEQAARQQGYDCNFDSQEHDIIYDNNAKAMSMSGKKPNFSCK